MIPTSSRKASVQCCDMKRKIFSRCFELPYEIMNIADEVSPIRVSEVIERCMPVVVVVDTFQRGWGGD